MDEWKPIPEFQNYSVSDGGLVRNENTGRILRNKRNVDGVCFVGLSDKGHQYQRSVGRLVVDAFLPPDTVHQNFTSFIHLDGDQTNNHIWNLMWRPRWFAVEYAKQFKNPKGENSLPVLEMRTREQYATAWDAALAFGLLSVDVIQSIMNRTVVWPTFQEFRFIKE